MHVLFQNPEIVFTIFRIFNLDYFRVLNLLK